jgi:transglutaminase-like putative cysteine protease
MIRSREARKAGTVGWFPARAESNRSAGLRVKNWVEACAGAAEEAALYQQLSRLSDAELERRGIPRGELHRCIF